VVNLRIFLLVEKLLDVSCKVCSSCEENKPLCEFYSDKRAKDGKQSQCKACHKSFYKTEKGKAVKKKSYNPEKRAAYYQENKEDCLLKSKEDYRNNKDRKLLLGKKHYQENKSVYLYYTRKRQAKRLMATLSLTSEQEQQIKDFYWLAKDLTAVSGETYHVDHIVPLQGKNVCGLHVPWNLQVLPADINLSKGNKYDNDA